MTFLYLAAALALGALVWLANGIRRIGAVSQGPKIGDRPGTAVLLVDLQSVFWDHGPYSAAARSSAQAIILQEIASARAQGFPVIALRQEWSIPSTRAIARLAMKGQAMQGSEGVDLAGPFAGLADHVLVKRVQDAFETGALDALLGELGVGVLRVVGLDLNHCVLKTALAARNRGFQVTVVKDGTLSAAPANLAEAQLAAHGVALH